MKTVEEIRRDNLRRLVDEAGGITALNSRLGRSGRDSTFNQILNRSANSKGGKPKTMGPRMARGIEKDLSLPKGWMDTHHGEMDMLVASAVGPLTSGYIRLEHLSPRPSMGGGALMTEPVQIVQYLDVLERWVRQHVGSTNPSKIKVLTADGNSMAPTIQDRDLVFIDVECHTIERAGIYVLDVAGRLILKKAMILADGTLIIRSDNVTEYPDEERYDLRRAANTITVCGKVLAWWTLRKG